MIISKKVKYEEVSGGSIANSIGIFIILVFSLLQKLKADARYCAALFERIPKPELEQEYLHWYEQALIGQHAVALVDHWFEHHQRFSQEQAKALLQKALVSGDIDVFYYIAVYTGQFYPHDETLAEVWIYANCIKSAACNEQQLSHHYLDYYNVLDSERIISRAEKILQQLQENQPVDIDP